MSTIKKNLNYYQKYFTRHKKYTIYAVIVAFALYTPFLLLSSIGASLILLKNEYEIIDILQLTICGVIFIPVFYIFVFGLIYSPVTRIIPYFQYKMEDGINTYLFGLQIAKNCQRLDQIADQMGLCMISEFGFNDDWKGEELQWHDPKKGLETIEGLLAKLHENPKLLKKTNEVIQDL